MMKKFVLIVFFAAIATPFIGYASVNSIANTQQEITKSEKKPLYWVDPMEPNVHYSAPGKSRMGMELVPVYSEQQQTTNQADVPSEPAKE